MFNLGSDSKPNVYVDIDARNSQDTQIVGASIVINQTIQAVKNLVIFYKQLPEIKQLMEAGAAGRILAKRVASELRAWPKTLDFYLPWYVSDKSLTNKRKLLPSENKESSLSSIETEIDDFLKDRESFVFLLIGEAGSGKTLFSWVIVNCLLERLKKRLAKNKDQALENEWLPIRLSLADYNIQGLEGLVDSLSSEDKYGEAFKKLKFPEPESNEPKLLLILDGFDELRGLNQKPLKGSLLETIVPDNRWQGRLKTVVTSRPILWMTPHEEQRIFGRTFTYRQLLPFTIEEVQRYLSYIYSSDRDTLKKIQQVIGVNTSLRESICNPLLLSFFVESFSELLKTNKENLELFGVIRLDIYRQFLKKWFKSMEVDRRPQYSSYDLGCDSPEELEIFFEQACQNLASIMFHKSVLSVPIVISLSDPPKDSFQAAGVEFYKQVKRNEEEELKEKGKKTSLGNLVKKASEGQLELREREFMYNSPLKISTNEKCYEFFHTSFRDYFLTEKILKMEMEEESTWEVLNFRKIQEVPEVLLFLWELRYSSLPVHQGELMRLEKILEHILKQSKTNPTIAQISANAITILNAMDLSFIGKDYSKIQAPGAYLRNAVFAHANLSGAVLEEAYFDHANFLETDLQNTNLQKVQWNELPWLECGRKVIEIAHHPKEPWLAIMTDWSLQIRHRDNGSTLDNVSVHDHINCIVFNPVKELLASGHDSGTIRLWIIKDLGKLDFLMNFNKHTQKVNSIAFSSDGQQLISGSDDKTVQLKKIVPGGWRDEGIIIENKYVVSRIAFVPPDDTCVALSSKQDTNVQLRQIKDGKVSKTFRQTANVKGISFNSDGSLLAVECLDNKVHLWNVKRIAPLYGPITFPAVNKNHTFTVQFSPNGKLLAIGHGEQELQLWDVEKGEPYSEVLRGHPHWISSVAFTRDGQMLITGSFDHTARIWNLSSHVKGAKTVQSTWDKLFRGYTESICSVAVHPNEKWLVSGNKDGRVQLWDLNSYQPIGESQVVNENWVHSVSFSADGCFLAAGGGLDWQPGADELKINNEIHNVRLLEVKKTGLELLEESLIGPTRTVRSLAFSPIKEKRLLACGNWDAVVWLWEEEKGEWKLRDKQKCHSEEIYEERYRSNGGKEYETQEDIYSIAFNPPDTDVQLLAVGFWLGDIWLFNVEKNQLQIQFKLERPSERDYFYGRCAIYSVMFHPKKTNSLVSASSDGSVRLWEWDKTRSQSKKLKHKFIRYKDEQSSAVFSPDGKFLVTGGNEKIIRLWKVSSQECEFLTLLPWHSAINSMIFIREEKRKDDSDKTEYILAMVDARNILSFWSVFSIAPYLLLKYVPRTERSLRCVELTNLKGCRMSILGKRLFKQYEAEVDEVVVQETKDSKEFRSFGDSSVKKLWEGRDQTFLFGRNKWRKEIESKKFFEPAVPGCD